MKKRKLGDILIDEGLITEEQLEKALVNQKGKNKRLGKILIEMGYITDLQVAETITKQLSIQMVDCSKYSPSRAVLSLIPKEVAEKKIIVPLELRNTNLLVAMANPLDWETIEDISFETGMKLSVAISSENSILSTIENLYGSAQDSWDLLKEMPTYESVEFVKQEEASDNKNSISYQALYHDSEAPPIVKLVTMLIADAVNFDSSDIHIEPRAKNVQVRYRIDGNLKNIHQYSLNIHDSVVSRIKIISNLDITNRRFPQDGRSALRLKNKTVDLRISTLPSVHGETVVIRLLDPTVGLIALSSLGISDSLLRPIIDVFSQPQGMLLVTGPTGSGKTTTLYSILQQLRAETKNIITLEDPVEYKLPDITQVHINDAIGFSFANALRSVLRQDPDIVMVGEIRDAETAEIAARAALTGHMVLSTVHTNDTVSTITRLIDIGLKPFLVTAAVSGVLSQRLVRKICNNCKVEALPPEELARFNVTPLKKYFKGKGCDKCNHTGYKGRVGIYELVVMNTKLKRLISKNQDNDDIWECVRSSGTKSLFEDAWEKVAEGVTSVEEIIAKIPYPNFLHEVKREEEVVRK